MKINFKPISIEDKDVIASFTYQSSSQNCDFAVMNICSWQFFYHSEYAVVDGFLLLRFRLNDGHLAYMFPLGKGDLKIIIEMMRQDAKDNGEKELCLMGISLDEKLELDRTFPGWFKYIRERDYFDYIYRRLDLAELKGKRHQSKRNHVNKFKNNYTYEYVELTPDIVPECLKLEEKWRTDNTISDRETLLNESRSMTLALQNLEKLGGFGGAIRIDGRIVAFSFGSPINQDTFCVHVEKADTKIEGLYSAINQLFSAHIPEKYTYVNREEDLGIEGLRKAKLSYLPSILLDKNVAIMRDYSEDDISENDAEIKRCVMDLWQSCFSDTPEFVQFFFSRKYKRRNTLIYRNYGQVVSSLQMLPYRMVFGAQEMEMSYIAGVCTLEEQRGNGFSSNLMMEAMTTLCDRDVDIATLIPATEDLFGFYAKFGFVTVFEKKEQTISRTDFVNSKRCLSEDHLLEEWNAEMNFHEIYTYFHKNEQERDLSVLHSYEELINVLDDFYADGGKLLLIRDSVSKGINGLAFVRMDHTRGRITEVMLDNEALSANLYCYLFSNHPECMELTLRVASVGGEGEKPYGMARVTNVSHLLETLVKEYPNAEFMVCLTDDVVTENAGTYTVDKGSFKKTKRKSDEGLSMSISEFTEAIFGKNPQCGLVTRKHPFMNLMMD